VGGLKGISGSLAIHLASNGAKHIAVMSRGGYEDKVSQHMARNIRALGCSLSLHQGDVTSIKDVRRVFSEILVPVGGIIQGAAVFRVRHYSQGHIAVFLVLITRVPGSDIRINVSRRLPRCSSL
jgi:NAD(P)-dependent dehydrogenase (short-subunit alcohol dehydrogenase family)